MNEEKPPHLARSMWKRFVLAGMLIVVLAGATTATGVLLQVNDLTKAIRQGGKPISGLQAILERAAAGSPQTILVIGSDRRFKDRRDAKNARSDTIILLRLNPRASATTIMSIPRDLEVHYHRGAPPDKINAAYSKGGPAATARIVKRVLSSPGDPFRINHIININFGGFRAVVDRLGCVYADVDRRYFNDNSQAGPGEDYATINLKPGYQRLCGQDALDYVRFRHADTDIVRSARQQDFLRQAKGQYGTGQLVSDRHRLARIFGRFTQSDSQLHSVKALLELMTLAISTASSPIREVHFPAVFPKDARDPYLTARASGIRRAVEQFLAASTAASKPATRRPSRRKSRRRRAPKLVPGAVPGLVNATSAGQQQGVMLGSGVGMPVYYPKLLTSNGSYAPAINGIYPRPYELHDRQRQPHVAYRLTVKVGELGNYYGIQGTTWKNPPLLAHPSETRVVGGRRLQLYFDGPRLRLVSWRHGRGVYWISNTLEELVPNNQMLGMAASFTRLGGR